MELISVSFIQVVKQLSKLTVNAFRKCDELQTQVTKAYAKQPGDKRIDRNPYNQLVSQKASIILGNLQLKQCQLIFIIRKQVRICICNLRNWTRVHFRLWNDKIKTKKINIF